MTKKLLAMPKQILKYKIQNMICLLLLKGYDVYF